MDEIGEKTEKIKRIDKTWKNACKDAGIGLRQVRAFVPIGMVECWNHGVMGSCRIPGASN
jgi:hypothetical protein